MKCLYCGKEFENKRAWQKFCSAACRLASWAVRQVKKGVEGVK